jgi:toxin ParE1/3/4
MAHRVAPQAETDLEEIAYYVFRESGSIEIADRLIDSITDRFALLGKYPHAGRRRDDLRQGLRGFPVGRYVILYRVDDDDALILRVVHGRRDLEALLLE